MATRLPKQDPDQFKSDQDILDEILDQYQEYEEALQDVMDGIVNPLIVRGPPGIGKSESVKISSKKAGIKSVDLVNSKFEMPVGDDVSKYPYDLVHEDIVDGALIRGADYSTWSLVCDLYANKSSGLVCIDDNDEILKKPDSLAILMKATEQEVWKEVSYPKAASTHELQLRGVEPKFKVKTPLIILSNIDFDLHVRAGRLKEEEAGKPMPTYLSRWEALMMSRGKYIDLQMNSPRRVRIFCEHLIAKTKMLEKSRWLKDMFGKTLTKTQSKEVIDWVRKNQGTLKHRLDLRTYNKVAAKMLRRKKEWQKSASVDLLRVV
jgi:hypothetical protein